MTIADTLDRRRLVGFVVLFAAALLVLSGCATIRRHEAARTEQLLAAAGFQRRPADSPERRQDLTTMPPFKLVAQSKDGNVVYTFSDPANCRCLYVGGPNESSTYERLRVEREIATDMNEASMNGDVWGPWGSR